MAINEQTFCRSKKQYLRLKIDQVWQLKKQVEDGGGGGDARRQITASVRGDRSESDGHGFC
jgi:hypothetical protein